MIRLLSALDRRIIYLVLLFATGAALVWTPVLPVIPSNQAVDAYNAVEKAPVDKFVLFGNDWSASTAGENEPQAVAMLHHMMRRHLKFGLIGFDPQSPDLVAAEIDKLAKQYGYEYGRDWVNFGYHPPEAINATLKAMVRDIPGSLGKDANGTPTSQIPVLKNVKDMSDVGLIVEVTPSATYERWVAFVQGVKNTPMVFCPTAVMAPEAYQYLDSGQMAGMLTGKKGALEYEGLVKKPGAATRQALALSVSHMVIVLLIVIGNIGYLAERRQKRLEREAGL